MKTMILDEVEYYNKYYADSESYVKEPHELVYYPMWTEIVNTVSGKITELGCGPGHLAKLFLESKKDYVAGYDFSEVAIEMAKKRNPKHKDKFHVQNIYKMKKLPKHTIIATETLEHLKDDLFVIGLLPKTRFIFSVPNFKYKYHYHVFKDEDEIVSRYKRLKIRNIKRFELSTNKIIFLVDSEK